MTPTLKQSMMQVSIREPYISGVTKVEKLVKVVKLVLLWEEVGLCIHRGGIEGQVGYTISHFNSGKSVLSGIKTKDEVMKYLKVLQSHVMKDWTFTSKDWQEYRDEDKSAIKVRIDKLQNKIYGIVI